MVKKSKIRELAASAIKKRASNGLNLTLPLARARKLAGDLYEAAGLKLWADALETAHDDKKTDLIRLQDAICDAGDFLRSAKANNPRHLKLFCIEDEGAPRFVTAADETEALRVFRAAGKPPGPKGSIKLANKAVGQQDGDAPTRVRRPKIFAVPTLAPSPRLHDASDA